MKQSSQSKSDILEFNPVLPPATYIANKFQENAIIDLTKFLLKISPNCPHLSTFKEPVQEVPLPPLQIPQSLYLTYYPGQPFDPSTSSLQSARYEDQSQFSSKISNDPVRKSLQKLNRLPSKKTKLHHIKEHTNDIETESIDAPTESGKVIQPVISKIPSKVSIPTQQQNSDNDDDPLLMSGQVKEMSSIPLTTSFNLQSSQQSFDLSSRSGKPIQYPLTTTLHQQSQSSFDLSSESSNDIQPIPQQFFYPIAKSQQTPKSASRYKSPPKSEQSINTPRYSEEEKTSDKPLFTGEESFNTPRKIPLTSDDKPLFTSEESFNTPRKIPLTSDDKPLFTSDELRQSQFIPIVTRQSSKEEIFDIFENLKNISNSKSPLDYIQHSSKFTPVRQLN